MSVDALLYCWSPGAVAIASLVLSTMVSWKRRRFTHWCISLIVFACVFWSLFTLYRIFALNEQQVGVIVVFGKEWRNRIPQLITVAAMVISMSQVIFQPGRKTGTA